MLKAMDIICGPPEAAGLTFLVVKRHSNDVTYTYTARVQCSVCWRHWNGHEQRRRRLLLMLLNQFLFGEAQSDPLHLQLDNAGKNPIATRVCVCVLSVWVRERVCVLLCTLTDWQSFLAWHSVLKCWRKCWKLAKELRLFASIVAVVVLVVVIYLTENMKVI